MKAFTLFKRFFLFATAISVTLAAAAFPQNEFPVEVYDYEEENLELDEEALADSLPPIIMPIVVDSAFLVVREPEQVFRELPFDARYTQRVNPFRLPDTYVGYRRVHPQSFSDNSGRLRADGLVPRLPKTPDMEWLEIQQRLYQSALDRNYSRMIDNPQGITGIYWLLHKAPESLSPDSTFTVMLEGHEDAGFRFSKPVFPEYEMDQIHWLHVLNAGVQLSQAYLSPNWYQGGNNHLSLLVNFLWDVQLNPAYHPNMMMQSTLSYKLGLNSNTKDQLHSYSITQDLLQWNFKYGYRSFKKWFYTFTAQFKTQLLNNYEVDSDTRIASFLSSGDLNLGLGMTYATENKKKNFKLNVSIAPLSYNLKTCIDSKVNPLLFGIPAGKKTVNEIGSNVEVTTEWKIIDNISYKSRLFLFTDYKYFLGDWENTFNFSINRFLSTQLYIHARYDSSYPGVDNWKHWMLKEILSFGFSYTFSTKN